MGHFYAAVVLCKNFAKKKKIVYNQHTQDLVHIKQVKRPPVL